MSVSGNNSTSNPVLALKDSNWKVIDDVAWNIETYYLWVIFALGFPGNCATVVTIIKMSPARSLTVYIALLAIIDNLAIVNKILMFVLTDNASVSLGSFGCKFMAFCGNFLVTLANWLLVAMSVERCVAVWFPFTVGQNWTFRKSLFVVVGITSPIFVLFLHLFWTIDYIMVDYPGSSFCGVPDKYLPFMIDVWFWVSITVYALLPCVLLVTCNVLITVGIIKARKLHQYLNRSCSGLVDSGNIATLRQRQITIMLLTAAVALVVLTIPRCIFLILSPYWTFKGNTVTGATVYLMDTIAYVLCDSTHAMNFYLYFLSARRFRRQFKDFMCRRRKKRRPATEYISFLSRRSLRFNHAAMHEQKKQPASITLSCMSIRNSL